jgi:4-hydroxybenzoate polyprenyltransferase
LSERFPPAQFTLLAGLLAAGSGICLQAQAYGRVRHLQPILLAFLGLLFFLFRLRLFDELKDYAHDLRFYPERPLPRGLMTTGDIAVLIVFSLAVETSVAVSAGMVPLVYFFVSVAYSFLMFREFFLRGWLRKRFTIYVLSHELLVIPLFFYVAALQGFAVDLYKDPLVWTVALFSGCQLFSLEISRKMRPPELENIARDTYTSQYGIRGASALLATTGTVAVALGFLASGGRNPLYAAALVPFAHVLRSLRCFVRRPDAQAAAAVFNAAVLHFCLLNGLTIWAALA